MSIKYEVKDPLLKLIISGISNCKETKLKMGGWIDNDNLLARSLLTYCAQRNFNIHRMPGYQEEILAKNRSRLKEASEIISKIEIDNACTELMNLYNATQNYLQEVSSSGKINLKRSISQYELEQIKRQLESGCEKIKFQSNTITSYSTNGEIGEYMSPVLISRKVDIKDILIHHECLIFAGSQNCDYVDDETEVWVMNTDPFGLVELEASNFNVKKGYIANKNCITNPLYEEVEIGQRSKYTISTHCIKPCESQFIRRMIKWEKKIKIFNNFI